MSVSSQTTSFSLYHYRACPFCAYTRSAMKVLYLQRHAAQSADHNQTA